MILKRSIMLSLVFLSLFRCSAPDETDEEAVKKIVIIREYLVLDQDFTRLDSLRQQMSIEKFDINNNLLENADHWGRVLKVGSRSVHKYDDANRKTDEYYYDLPDEWSIHYVYEHSKNTATIYAESQDNTKVKSQDHYYDDQKNLIREIYYNPDGTVMNDFYYKYDAQGKLIERGGKLGHEQMDTDYKTYDSLQNLTEQKYIDSNGVVVSLEKFTYANFDKNGNWQVRKSTVDGIPHSVAFQTIKMEK